VEAILKARGRARWNMRAVFHVGRPTPVYAQVQPVPVDDLQGITLYQPLPVLTLTLLRPMRRRHCGPASKGRHCEPASAWQSRGRKGCVPVLPPLDCRVASASCSDGREGRQAGQVVKRLVSPGSLLSNQFAHRPIIAALSVRMRHSHHRHLA